MDCGEGEVLPWYYGAAFIRWETNGTACYLLGWHLVVRYARRLWVWFRGLGFDGEIRRGHEERVMIAEAYNRGHDTGYAAGLRHNRTILTDELRAVMWASIDAQRHQ